MKGKKILKIVLIVILVLIVLLLVNTIRKYIIVKDLQNKISKYTSSNNYHMSLTSYNKIIGQKGKVEYYKKDKKELYIMETTLNEKNAKLSSYNNGERIDVFYEGPDYKNAEIDSDFISKIELHNGIDYTGSDLNTFLTCLMGVIKINSTKYNDIDCYLVTLGGKEKYYIEKDTGLLLKSFVSNYEVERSYEFNNVSDEVFIEPDIGQYTILKNNLII